MNNTKLKTICYAACIVLTAYAIKKYVNKCKNSPVEKFKKAMKDFVEDVKK